MQKSRISLELIMLTIYISSKLCPKLKSQCSSVNTYIIMVLLWFKGLIKVLCHRASGRMERVLDQETDIKKNY